LSYLTTEVSLLLGVGLVASGGVSPEAPDFLPLEEVMQFDYWLRLLHSHSSLIRILSGSVSALLELPHALW
jgi:hypothetical protein